jgi:hypothetical protein
MGGNPAGQGVTNVENKQGTTDLYRGKPLEARPVARSVARIRTLTKQLSEALNYATAPSTWSYWSRSQECRFWQGIERKQAECRRLIGTLPSTKAEELLEVTEAAWVAAEEQHRDRPDPEIPFLDRAEELLAEIREGVAA